MARLPVEEAAERVENFLRAMTLELQMMARACGKSYVKNLDREDLRALTLESALMTGLAAGGDAPPADDGLHWEDTESMITTTDVLVIGGGLIGCATAYYLAKRGVRVTVAERREAPGKETTARSGAIIRAHYGVPELVTLAWEANQRYARFADEVGGPCGFVRCGYSVLVDKPATSKPCALNVCMHQGARRAGVALIPAGSSGRAHAVAKAGRRRAWSPGSRRAATPVPP